MFNSNFLAGQFFTASDGGERAENSRKPLKYAGESAGAAAKFVLLAQPKTSLAQLPMGDNRKSASVSRKLF